MWEAAGTRAAVGALRIRLWHLSPRRDNGTNLPPLQALAGLVATESGRGARPREAGSGALDTGCLEGDRSLALVAVLRLSEVNIKLAIFFADFLGNSVGNGGIECLPLPVDADMLVISLGQHSRPGQRRPAGPTDRIVHARSNPGLMLAVGLRATDSLSARQTGWRQRSTETAWAVGQGCLVSSPVPRSVRSATTGWLELYSAFGDIHSDAMVDHEPWSGTLDISKQRATKTAE
jgi:hypothetical protein